ncbi:winged helix-turn-helix domain-containing protein [Gallaecimonas sp. GXIMD4217]|uniref:winged helix-turn-helix domain-containing protein n=1 Tax=Gallaecimonas sp. GXIMD4217 TaxID=3131927 RepID=UPI00311B3549
MENISTLTSDNQARAFILGEWLVRPDLNLLIQGDQEVALEPRAMVLLEALARQAGEAVSREALLDEAWPDIIVSDNALNQFIVKLRRALGDDAKNPSYIVTVPKKGYRLIAKVEEARLNAVHIPSALKSEPTAKPRRRLLWLYSLGVLVLMLPLLLRLFTELAWNQGFEQRIPLTSLPGTEEEARFRPGDNAIVFVNHNDRTSGLYYQKMPDQGAKSLREPQVLLESPHHLFRSPDWSPDGSRLIYISQTRDQCEIHMARFQESPPALTEARKVADCRLENPHTMVRFGEDENTILYNHRDSQAQPYRIYRKRLSTGRRLQLTNPVEPGAGDIYFVLSEDHLQLAVLRARQWPAQELHFLNPKHGDNLPNSYIIHISGGLHRYGFSWAEDLRHYYMMDVPGKLERVDSNLLSQTLVEDEPVHSPLYDSGQDQLLVVQGDLDRDIYRMDNPLLFPDAKPQGLLVSDADDHSPSFGQDGEIYFASRRSGKSQYWRLSHGIQLQLTDLDEEIRLSQLQLGGEQLTAGTEEGIVLLGAADNLWDLEPILTDYKPVNARLSTDGQYLYFASEHSGDWQLWRRHSASGELEQITASGGFCGQTDAKGRYLYFTRFHLPGLWRHDLETGTEQQVEANIAWQRCDAWQLTEGGVYYLTEDTGQEIQRFDLHAKRIDRVLRLPNGYSAQFSVSPDEKSLLFTKPKAFQSDLVLFRR